MEAKLLLQLHQSPAFGNAVRPFDIMGEHESKFLAVGPAWPASGRLPRSFVNGPDILEDPPFSPGHYPAQGNAQAPRKKWLKAVIKTVPRHENPSGKSLNETGVAQMHYRPNAIGIQADFHAQENCRRRRGPDPFGPLRRV
jgi:hypothetical protein